MTTVFLLLKQAFTNLKANDPVRMAGATAFFAFFALPPIVIILSNILSRLYNDRYQRVSGQFFDELADLFGHKSADQLEDISHRLQQPKAEFYLTLLGFVLLLLSSTTLFAILKNSLNQLWNIKSKQGGSFLNVLGDKLIAMAIIIGSGLLFSLSLLLEQFMNRLGNEFSLSSLSYYHDVVSVANYLTSVVIRMIWFAILFKFLPDIRIPWRAVWLGALFTSSLFKVGEAILNKLLVHSQLGLLYGTSGAIILLLLFVFYASLIFYYGAAFTRQYTEWTHLRVEPNSRAVAYTITEAESADTRHEEKD